MIQMESMDFAMQKNWKTKVLIASGVRHLMRAVYEVEEHAQSSCHKKLVMRTAAAAHAHNRYRRTTHVLVRHLANNNNRALKVVPASRHGLKTALTHLTHISSNGV